MEHCEPRPRQAIAEPRREARREPATRPATPQPFDYETVSGDSHLGRGVESEAASATATKPGR